MALLHGANLLSTSHLTALGWGFSRERAAQMRLKRLHDSGYVDRFRDGTLGRRWVRRRVPRR